MTQADKDITSRLPSNLESNPSDLLSRLPKENQATMSLNEALRLAYERGYVGERKSFSNSFTRNKNKKNYQKYGIKRIAQAKGKPAKYIDVGEN